MPVMNMNLDTDSEEFIIARQREVETAGEILHTWAVSGVAFELPSS